MNKLFAAVFTALFAFAVPAFADNHKKDEKKDAKKTEMKKEEKGEKKEKKAKGGC